jgi:putative addiction module component (TIGR02574 family)
MQPEFSYLMTLNVPQKLELIGALWQSLERDQEQIDVSDELIAELDRRKEAAQLNPESLVPWEQVKQRLGINRAN